RAACLWQMLPPRTYVRRSGGPRFAAIFVALPLGTIAAVLLGRPVEQALFGGDIRTWLDHSGGRAIGGWILLLGPALALLVIALVARVAGPWQRRISAGWTRAQASRFDLVKFLVLVMGTITLTWFASWLLDASGFDPRGG